MDTKTQAAPTVRERVTAGAAWLDQHRPGWLDRIDVITLDVADPECCVLGQEYGDYADRPDALRDTRTAVRLGFYVGWYGFGVDRRAAEYVALTEAWRDFVLTEGPRRAAACCPCRGVICDPGCACPECPHDESELTDD